MNLERLINLLEMTAVAGRPLSVADIQKATDLPRPTCYRIVQTLADHRLLDDPQSNSRYVIGERLVRIALLGTSDVDVRKIAAGSLKAAAIKYGEAVFLSRFRNKKVEIIHVETPEDPTRAFIHPGLGERPMHACSCSKVIAAFAENDFQNEILNGPMRAYTANTKVSKDDLRDEFAAVRKAGYAECNQEIEVGVSSVAAPIRIGTLGATFSVGAVGPARRFNDAYRAELGRYLGVLGGKVGAAIQFCKVADL